MPNDHERPADGTFVLAHLSDPHLPTRPHAWPHAFFNKRVFGYLSWRLRRRRIHRREVLDALVSDLHSHRPDHVAVTGDIVNIALPAEFTSAAVWLSTLGDAHHVSVVPGNHDAYVPVVWRRSWAAWHAFMSGDPAVTPVPPETSHFTDPSVRFPYLRERGPVAVIGLSTAVPTGPRSASGRIGAPQLQRLAELLDWSRERGLCRVILLHHPPDAEYGPKHKRLIDAEPFRAVIARAGAELILHGHEHRSRRRVIAGPAGPVPIFGVGSASMRPLDIGAAAEYHLHRVTPSGNGWSLETRVRCYHGETGRFVEAGGEHRHLPHPVVRREGPAMISRTG